MKTAVLTQTTLFTAHATTNRKAKPCGSKIQHVVGSRQLYHYNEKIRVNYTLVFSPKFIFFSLSAKTSSNRTFYTSRQAPRCGVDDKCLQDVAHNKNRHNEQGREDFSPGSAP